MSEQPEPEPSNNGDVPEETFPKPEPVPGLVRTKRDSYGYSFAFTNEADAKRFVVAFWKEFDKVRGLKDDYQMGPRFENGRLTPSKKIFNDCTTQISNALGREQKEGGVTKVLYVSGHDKAIPFEGIVALSHLVELPEEEPK